MRYHPNADIGAAKFNSVIGANDDKDVTVTCAAAANVFHALDWVTASYDTTGSGVLSVSVGGNVVWSHHIYDIGHFEFTKTPIYTQANQILLVTLAGFASLKGSLSTCIRTSVTPSEAEES